MKSLIIFSICLPGLFATSSFTDTDYCGIGDIPPYHPPAEDLLEKVGSLKSVNVFFRHGTRGDYHKNSCYRNKQQTSYKCSMDTRFEILGSPDVHGGLVKKYKAGCQVGQLLDYASVQMDRLGRYLRETYPSLATDPDIYLRSTDIQRTLASLDLLLGVIRPGDKKSSVVTDEFEYDSLDLSYQDCRRANDINDSFRSSPGFLDLMNEDSYKQCKATWFLEIGTEFNLAESGDCLFSPKCAGVPLPGKIVPSDSLFQCVFEIYNKVRQLKYSFTADPDWRDKGREYCLLATGVFMREFHQVIRERNMSGLWATHDDTIACMLSMLDIWDGVWPKYASFVVFEYYSAGQVRILRDGRILTWFDKLSDIVPDDIVNESKYNEDCSKPYSGVLLNEMSAELGTIVLAS